MARGWSACTISARTLAMAKLRSRWTRQTTLRGPNNPSSAGRSGTERSSARASGSSTLRPASVPGILLQWQVAEGGGQAVVVLPGRDRAASDLHLVDLVGA